MYGGTEIEKKRKKNYRGWRMRKWKVTDSRLEEG